MEHTPNQTRWANDIPHSEQIALSARIKNGDRDAFARLIELSRKQIYAVIWRFMRNHEDTDDILQDAYLRLYEKAPGLHADRPIMPYLRKIAINLSINKLRATKRMVSLDNTLNLSDNAKPDRDAESNEMLASARKAITTLPREQQLVLMLRVQDELSYQEIADTLQLRLGTVMSRLARAREKLLKYMKKQKLFHKIELQQ